MFICRLFNAEAPFQQVEARLLAEGETTIGRAGDWSLPDVEGVLSRVHCTLAVQEGRLFLRDKSTNGTFLDDGSRAPFDSPIELAARDSIRLGRLSILVDYPDESRIDGDATTLLSSLSLAHATAPRDWIDAPPREPARADGSLIEAFCEGAGLDASMLSSEDSTQLMTRVGEIYRQTVLGLATLMEERSRLKQAYDLDRTTIGPADNNPFKWTPSRALALELLRSGDAEFLGQADAVRASFEDLGLHIAALGEGASAALKLAIEVLSPDSIAEEARGQGALLRGRASWTIHNCRHASLTERDGEALKRAFGEAYSRALAKSPV